MFKRVWQVIKNLFPFSGSSSVIMMLGREYQTTDEDELAEFQEDFSSRLWLTYRHSFSPINASGSKGLSRDDGWGCMVRVAQMALAQSLVALRLGRDWRYSEERDLSVGSVYLEILSHFLDVPTATFSVQSLVELGEQVLHKQAGTWFGPSSAALVAQEIFDKGAADKLGVSCATFADGLIVRSVVLDKLKKGGEGVIVLWCRKLGPEDFNMIYKDAIQKLFALPQFQGLASGGPTTAAYFFVACNDAELFYLDPHVHTQPALTSTEIEEVKQSYLHTPRPLRLQWNSLNASVCGAFLVRSAEDFEKLCEDLTATDDTLFEILDRPLELQALGEAVDTDDGFTML
mmetsp:Transcript_47468/g.125635  ORF Transcript_47468/g.125635 Transcript_47468/m.125635 type:complete len:345 (+) Transcript_47468:32-1066(+)